MASAKAGNLARKLHVHERSESFCAAIESAQSHLELCTVALECLMVEDDCGDMANFGAIRLRLAHANLTRTRIAQEACRYLISRVPAEGAEALCDLQQRETAHFQLISQHIQRWTTNAVQNEWLGYRDATRKLLETTRALVAIENRFLLPLLRQRL